MEKLLQWAVNNSDQEELKKNAEAIRKGEVPVDRSKFDPKIIESILGKDDATRMQEALKCITDPEDTIENKEIALDNFELLIEHIDNAKNIENMKMWPTIISLYNAPEPEIRKGALWISGTAVQNNPAAQKAYLANGGLEPLVNLLKNDQNTEVKAKALYAISGLLKHCPSAVEAFELQGGFKLLGDLLKESDNPNMVRKIVFLLNSLMIDNAKVAKLLLEGNLLQELDVVLVKYTKSENQDEDMIEKTLRTLHTLVTQTCTSVSPEMKQHVEEARSTFGQENLGLAAEEWTQLA
ncbi:armadillo-type protein [Syncephalastrum racemosum]|uniref:Armadillo-type protein n=1 Tax=Syncephalastrum racemosum TaxID=13706 RepID=A0A1X2HRH9_SYNRA|nr:armadillo-type protein [Syncephalastrum racemosum]